MKIQNQDEIEKYIHDIKGFVRLSKVKERELAEIIANSPDGDVKDRAINELVEGNLFLVVNLVLKRRHSNIDLMELMYAGNLALIRAAREYSITHSSGAGFSTFAFTAISNVLNDVEKDKLIYLPKTFVKFNKTVKAFEEKHGIKATPYDIAGMFSVSIDRAQDIRAALDLNTASLETLVSEDGSWEDIHGEVDLNFQRNLLNLDLSQFTKKLKPIQQEIIRLMYLEEGLNFEEAGKKLGFTKQRAEQICRAAMKEMRVKLIREWDKAMSNPKKRKDIKGKELLNLLIESKDKMNKKIYRELVAHYLGK